MNTWKEYTIMTLIKHRKPNTPLGGRPVSKCGSWASHGHALLNSAAAATPQEEVCRICGHPHTWQVCHHGPKNSKWLWWLPPSSWDALPGNPMNTQHRRQAAAWRKLCVHHSPNWSQEANQACSLWASRSNTQQTPAVSSKPWPDCRFRSKINGLSH